MLKKARILLGNFGSVLVRFVGLDFHGGQIHGAFVVVVGDIRNFECHYLCRVRVIERQLENLRVLIAVKRRWDEEEDRLPAADMMGGFGGGVWSFLADTRGGAAKEGSCQLRGGSFSGEEMVSREQWEGWQLSQS